MGFDLNNLVRSNIKAMVPYSSARHEFDGEAAIFLDANENSFGSPIGNGYNRYPDPLQSEVRRVLAEMHRVSASQIFVGNGSDEAIDLLIRIFCRPGVDNIVICPPTYGMYEIAAAINDITVKRANLTPEFELDMGAIGSAVDGNTKITFFCSPNNPTGNLLSREAILNFVSSFEGVVVVDEAYIHYSGTASFVDELAEHSNLVVLHTFSKAWGLAGLRLGLAFAGEEIVDLLFRVKPPYNIGQPAQELVLQALFRRADLKSTVRMTANGLRELEEGLKPLKCVRKVYPSNANFLLVRLIDAADTYAYLLSKEIVVRNRSTVTLCGQSLRITVGTPEENKTLLKALRSYEASFIH